jgi:hypothetical protein
MNNERRKTLALAVLARFAKDTGLNIDVNKPEVGDGLAAALTDLLTDLRHCADSRSIDFHRALDLSYDHYLAEKQDGA